MLPPDVLQHIFWFYVADDERVLAFSSLAYHCRASLRKRSQLDSAAMRSARLACTAFRACINAVVQRLLVAPAEHAFYTYYNTPHVRLPRLRMTEQTVVAQFDGIRCGGQLHSGTELQAAWRLLDPVTMRFHYVRGAIGLVAKHVTSLWCVPNPFLACSAANMLDGVAEHPHLRFEATLAPAHVFVVVHDYTFQDRRRPSRTAR
jgi:hypothetical protein